MGMISQPKGVNDHLDQEILEICTFKLLLSVMAMTLKIVDLQKTLPRLAIPDER